MNESISFWMDNRNCAGTKVATIGDQILVSYRDRYYVVAGGAALTSRGKPMRFSISSMPSPWKQALKGDVPHTFSLSTGIDSAGDVRPAKNARKKKEKSVMPKPQIESSPPPEKSAEAAPAIAKAKRAVEPKPTAQPPVTANCPYCNARHEIPLEKGKSCKPFFVPCSKCNCEFAVRFVQVMIYQAQVAGFR